MEDGRGRKKRKRIINIIKEIHKSDTFFIFINIDYVTNKTYFYMIT